MNPTGKKFLSLFLVFSLMMLSVNLYAKEKRGAILIITKKNGQQIGGELITIKKDSLLLFTGVDVSVDISEIKVIKIVKTSKVLQGLGFGLLIGAGGGGLLGLAFGSRDFMGGSTALEDAAVTGIFLGSIGLLVGGTLGFASGIDKTILVEGMTDSDIQKTLDKLRKKARIRNYK